MTPLSSSPSEPHVVILGAGHGGGTLAALLRQYGHGGPITIVGSEPRLPYERPPLSKAWLRGGLNPDSLALRPEEFYRAEQITTRLGVTARAIDRGRRSVALDDGSTLDYDVLVIATGARPRRLPAECGDGDDVLHLRDQSDATRIRDSLGPGKRVVLCGGGYIGLEIAAAARGHDMDVTVVEQQPRLLNRVASPQLAEFLRGYHEANSVRVVLSASVASVQREAGRVTAVELATGEQLSCDVVVVGVGAEPRLELAADAGLPCAEGILVDELARTADPDIFAIGDVTARPVPFRDGHVRLESVPSTLEQAKQAAGAIAGRVRPVPEVPWFWSDQYDLKIQIAGLYGPSLTTTARGVADDGMTVTHDDGDHLVSVEAVNRPGDFMIGKKLIGRRDPLGSTLLRNPTLTLRDLAKQPVQ
ncbi:NAD(P)/FAD-dependent oxidoreductase [Actinomadura rubrisoli]|uniref:Ferredoxin reductase n=1 Tax=Actinomadura rubrisoli TaxID=2530368 RepID=A0A4R5C2G8_9ACTN|nr:FAD-dependent oxidoreductase [Actinomadura rubrisoli]TDD92233.1 ferredoxin reductase [Actinomadura rubrisoli]